MHLRCVFNHFAFRSTHRIYGLAAVWVAGLVLGIVLTSVCADDATDVMRTALRSAPAPFLVCLITGLPVAIAVFAVTTSRFAVLYPLLFLVSIGYGFCGMLIYLTLGSAAWLLRPMVLFNSCCTSVLIWWLVLRRAQLRRYPMGTEILITIVLVTAVSVLDILLILPILSELAIYF